MNKTDFALIGGGIWERVKGKVNIHILTPETYFNPLGDITEHWQFIFQTPLSKAHFAVECTRKRYMLNASFSILLNIFFFIHLFFPIPALLQASYWATSVLHSVAKMMDPICPSSLSFEDSLGDRRVQVQALESGHPGFQTHLPCTGCVACCGDFTSLALSALIYKMGIIEF